MHISNKDKFSHIIVNNDNHNYVRTPSRKILWYLQKYGSGREEEIAIALQISIVEVERVLEELEKKGIVEKTSSVNSASHD